MRLLVHDLSISQVKFATGPTEGKEKPKKEAHHARLALSCFPKEENLHTRHFQIWVHEVDLCPKIPKS